MDTAEDIKDLVRASYGSIAAGSGSSCCVPAAPPCCGYSDAGLKPGETVVDLGSGAGIDCFLAAQQV